MKRILIVCEAGKGKGLGHFYRSLALAQILETDYQITLLSNGENLSNDDFKLVYTSNFEQFDGFTAYDLIILDGYEFSTAFISKLSSSNIPFIEISDFQEQLYLAPFWINTSMKSDSPGKGLQYSLLRKEILEIAKNRTFEVKKPGSIFIAFGGTDELSNSIKTVKALLKTHDFTKIGVLYPENGKDLEALHTYATSESDVEIKIYSNLTVSELIDITDEYTAALVSSSTIACEMIALRKVVYTCCLYENQALLHNQLTTSNAAFSVNLEAVQNQRESLVVELIHLDIEQLTIFDSQKKLIDGKAEERIRTFISNCFE